MLKIVMMIRVASWVKKSWFYLSLFAWGIFHPSNYPETGRPSPIYLFEGRMPQQLPLGTHWWCLCPTPLEDPQISWSQILPFGECTLLRFSGRSTEVMQLTWETDISDTDEKRILYKNHAKKKLWSLTRFPGMSGACPGICVFQLFCLLFHL